MVKFSKNVCMVMVVLVCLSMFTSINVFAVSNPYPSSQTIGGVTTIPCTRYAWQQTYDRLGIAMPNWGNAINWLNRAASAGYSTGSVAKSESIAVWQSSVHSYGHVSYVTAVDGNYMTVNEGGMNDSNGNAANGTGIITNSRVSSVVGTKKSAYSSCTLLGFIYLSGTPVVHVSYTPNEEKNSISDTNAEVWCKIDKTVGVALEKIGIRVRKSDGNYSNGWSHYQTPNSSRVNDSWFYLYWNMNNELNLTLTHATQYYYQFYTKIGGNDYWSAEYSFTTTGSHSYGNWVIVQNATCTENGSKIRNCSKCSFAEGQIIESLGHDYETNWTIDKVVTCTESGSKSNHCTRCDSKTNVTIISATGHKYDKGNDIECNICGYVRTGEWYSDGQSWYYRYSDGTHLASAWGYINGDWYYFNQNGVMLTNWQLIDGSWYYFNPNGTMATEQWVKDSNGWCYLGSSGGMVTNSWIKDSVGWCYVGADGYCVTNCWMQDSNGWCYLSSSGRMATNQWIKDSVGWCYVGADGYCVTNCWMQDSNGWCYLDAEGRMVTNAWISDSNGYCWLDSNGYWNGVYA